MKIIATVFFSIPIILVVLLAIDTLMSGVNDSDSSNIGGAIFLLWSGVLLAITLIGSIWC